MSLNPLRLSLQNHLFRTVATALLLGAGSPVRACQVCVPYPGKSAADILLNSDTVVLAREDPGKPWFYRATEVLKGELADPSINKSIPSATRRLLEVSPERSVILARDASEADRGWNVIAVTGSGFEPVAREILAREAVWRDSPTARFQYFAKRLGDELPLARRLAHLEVARAPYREIRQLKDSIPRTELRAFLDDARYVEWHSLYILLLAIDAPEADRARIQEAMQTAARFNLTRNLAAWTTAYIEIKEDVAFTFLEEHYLHNPDRTAKEMAGIIAALSVCGTSEDGEMRDRIVKMYATLLKSHPKQALKVVEDLKAWTRHDLASEVGRLAASRPPIFDLTTTMKLRAYARESARP